MEAEQVLKLYDSCWFELNILKESPSSCKTSSSSSNSDSEIEKTSPEPKLSLMQTSYTRSTSDQLGSVESFKHEYLSPDSVLPPPKLQTILSGKEVTDPEVEKPEQIHLQVLPNQNIARWTMKKRESKSLSNLEFEELKGFMDLGFVFSEEDKDSSLASIIPGLQRLGKKDEEEEGDSDESAIPRPYLSEAWEVMDKEKKENPLMNWRVPALNNETDMKHTLRRWARTVASAVR